MGQIAISYQPADALFGSAFEREFSSRYPVDSGPPVFVVVIGPTWLATDHPARSALATALDRDHRVIAVLLDTDLPAADDLPADLKDLAGCAHLKAGDDPAKLADELAALLRHPPSPPPTPPPTLPPTPLSTSNVITGAVHGTSIQAGHIDQVYVGVEPTSAGAANFERRYLNFIDRENSTFELFQVAPGRAPVGYPIDEFYVIPPITRRQTGQTEADLTGTGTDAANAVAESRRILLLGGAGAGKTTFLTWVAHTVATGHDQLGPWHRVVPFYLSLRRFAEQDLPMPDTLLAATAPPLAGAAPDRWVSDVFAAGRAILLVDGLDELVAERRDLAKRWLTEFVWAYPEARYVVSSRPSTVEEDWFVDTPGRIGLARFELLPLSSSGLGRVVNRWYAAALTQESDPTQRDWLASCRAGLLAGLASRPQLRTLVSSPLLAALLCWLYRQNSQYLPHTRRELLKEALDWLLVRWDEAKPSVDPVQHGVAVEDELRMTKNEKLILLERFAAPMVREAELLVSKETAERRLDRAMIGLRSQGLDPARMLRHLMVRTGLLREHPFDQKIEFVHRTFRDYLAATDMVKGGELGNLVENAHKDSWYEVVFMAAAQAREKEVAELLRQLLARASSRATRRDQEISARLELLAAACLGYADVVDPDDVRIQVQNAVRRLIPPATFDDAEMLAKAGSFVIDLLPGPEDLTGPSRDEVAARVIRTLAMIGGEEAWEKIRPFTRMHQSTVIDELLRGWRQYDFADEYAETLLSHVDFGDRALEVRRWGMLPRLRHLSALRAIKLIGDVPLADPRADHDQFPLATIAGLCCLDIVANELIRDLAPLAGCRTLHTLTVTGFSVLTDLSALADSTVEDLTLYPMGRAVRRALADLATLAGAPLRRLAIQHPALRAGLHAIPAELPLTELMIGNRAGERSLLGVERWPELTGVTVFGVPDAAETEALAALPRLRRLTLASVPATDPALPRVRAALAEVAITARSAG